MKMKHCPTCQCAKKSEVPVRTEPAPKPVPMIDGVPMAMLVGRRVRIYLDRSRRRFVEGRLARQGDIFTIPDPAHRQCNYIVSPDRDLELLP